MRRSFLFSFIKNVWNISRGERYSQEAGYHNPLRSSQSCGVASTHNHFVHLSAASRALPRISSEEHYPFSKRWYFCFSHHPAMLLWITMHCLSFFYFIPQCHYLLHCKTPFRQSVSRSFTDRQNRIKRGPLWHFGRQSLLALSATDHYCVATKEPQVKFWNQLSLSPHRSILAKKGTQNRSENQPTNTVGELPAAVALWFSSCFSWITSCLCMSSQRCRHLLPTGHSTLQHNRSQSHNLKQQSISGVCFMPWA